MSYVEKLRLFKKDAKLYIASAASGAFSAGMSGVIFNLYLIEAGFIEDFIGFFLSISMFATAGVAFIAGMVTDRSSRKTIILGANVVSFFAVAVQYTALEPAGLLWSQLFLGLSSAFTQVAWFPYITDLSTSEERAHLFAFSSGISLIAVLFGNLLGGFLPGLIKALHGTGTELVMAYRLALWLSLIPQAAAILMIVPMTHDRTVGTRIHLDLGNVKHWSFIGKYATTVTIVGLGAGMIVIFFNLYFQEVFEVPPHMIGVIFGINTVVLASGNFLAPAMADRIGKVRTVVFTEAMSIPFLLMLSWVPQEYLYLAVTAYVTRNVLMNMAGPVSNAFFMEGLTREERATAVGIVRTGDSFVRGIAANIGGMLLAAGLYRVPYLLVSGLYVLSVVLFYSFFKQKESEMQALREAEAVQQAKPEESEGIT